MYRRRRVGCEAYLILAQIPHISSTEPAAGKEISQGLKTMAKRLALLSQKPLSLPLKQLALLLKLIRLYYLIKLS